MGNTVKVSDYVADFLVRHDIDTCFTVTGGGAMHLNDSFGHHPHIKSIYNHHEQACAMAADGYAKVTDKPALVCVTSGPGTTNTMTGVLGAWLDSLPMIIISGQMNYDTTIASTPLKLRQLGFQEYNIIDSIKPMTKYAEMVTDSNYIAYHLEKAHHLATTGRKGPVWLDIPLNIQSSKIEENNLVHYTPNHAVSKLSTEEKESIVDILNNAKKPAILAGYGVRMHDSYNEFLDFIERLQIPVLTEWNSNDLIPNTHPLYAGNPGSIGNRGGNFVLQNADVVLMLGCQLSIRQTSYAWHNFAKDAYKIAVNVDSEELSKPTVKIDYSINLGLKEFISSMDIFLDKNVKWNDWCTSINEKYPVVLPKHFENEDVISVYAFIKRLSDNLNAEDNVVLANGAACVAGLQAIETQTDQRVFTNAGASSMGYGIAAALGASVAKHKGSTICIEGDGSIQMNLQELQTIVHNNLNVKIFWINNDGYHSIKQTQNAMFKAEERGLVGAHKDSGISFPAAEGIAKAYNLKYFKITKTSELNNLKSILNENGPILCEIVTDPYEKFEPKLQSKMLEDGSFYTPPLDDMFPFLPREEMKANKFESDDR